MLSRILWVGAAGIALVAGMMLQGDWVFGPSHRSIDASIERAVDRSVDRTLDRTIARTRDRRVDSSDHFQVTDADGRQMEVSPEMKRAMAAAVGRLVKAEANHTVLRIRHASEQEVNVANGRRAQARAEVERLKAEIKAQDRATRLEQDAVPEEVRQEIADTVRDAVGN